MRRSTSDFNSEKILENARVAGRGFLSSASAMSVTSMSSTSSSAHCECSTQELVEVLDRSLEACCTPRDLEVLNVIVVFAAMFKKTRFELGIPQRVLGQAMEHIRRPDGRSDRGALSQTTVSTFEELRMTPILMLRYLPAFQRALQAMLTDELQVVYPSVPKEKAATLLSTRFAELQKWELQAEQTFWNAVDHCFSSSDIFEWQQAKNFYRNVTLPPSCLEAQPSSNAGATEFY